MGTIFVCSVCFNRLSDEEYFILGELCPECSINKLTDDFDGMP